MERASEADEIKQLVARAAGGDAAAASDLLGRYRERLRQMVALRLDRRLQGRVDASDVVQEAMIEAANRLRDYAADSSMDFFLWLRWLTCDKLSNMHRYHLGAQKRDAGCEVSLYRAPMPEASSVSLAQQLLGRLTSPTEAVARAELQLIVQEVLNGLDPIDREVLVLRSFEQLTNAETALVLGIGKSAASKRYVEALKRLNQAISAIPGLRSER